jgi:two-component system response regulator PhoP
MANPSLAIVEDNDDLRENWVDFFRNRNYNAWGAESAEAFFRGLAAKPTEIILLDLGLPGEDGLSVLAHLRQTQRYRFVVVTARNTPEDREAAMAAGAYAYFVKPIQIHALLDCLAQLRQRPASAAQAWRLDHKKFVLYDPGGQSMPLTTAEYKLLATLMSQPGRIFSKPEIVAALWGTSTERDYHGIEVMLSRLRNKALASLEKPLPIRAVQAIGLVFSAPARQRE